MWTDRIRKIMGSHSYVSFQLNDLGHAVHMNQLVDGRVAIIEIPSGTMMPSGARYVDVRHHVFASGRAFTNVLNKEMLLSTIEWFLYVRSRRPLIVQVTPQGWHENLRHKLVLALDDTGGHNKYINESGLAMTSLGFTVVNATRGGPHHPLSGESRCGMHYSHTGMDLLFLEDTVPSTFIPQERMFAKPEWRSSEALPPEDHIFHPMANALRRHLLQEPRSRDCLLIGHGADGGAVACLTRHLLERPVTIWFNPHSLGAEKMARLAAAGTTVPQMELLRTAAQVEYEHYVMAEADGVLCKSRTQAIALMREYDGRIADYVLLPGIDATQFHLRTREPSDMHYRHLWRQLAELSGRTLRTLQEATIIMETSHTARTKGKATVLRAFAELLTAEHKASDSLFLVMNITDPNRDRIGQEERAVATQLHALVAELGIRPWLITKDHFSQAEVQAMHQLHHVFVTGAVSEPWGMAVQQAAACQQIIVATTAVPSAIEALAPSGMLQMETMPELKVLKGDGVLFFEPGDHKAAAAAIRWTLEHRDTAAEMAARAQGLVARRFEWVDMVRDWLLRVGYEFDACGRAILWETEPPRRRLCSVL